eukprot:GFUD01011594.1.p1 GENE.GFUD01011594.1~~GFUD01011594.1.p1  ORF type:complete len:230 (-),score=60.57 GFUD01011594.1:82-771(-)
MRLFLLSIALSFSLVMGIPKHMLKKLEDAQLLKELEMLVGNLDEDQLEKLEAILGKDIDEMTEFDMIVAELKEMGMEDEAIADLKQLAHLMNEFLSQVPELSAKLEFSSEYDLRDNIQLYLLGLPNKLGPLGYFAMHHVLEANSYEVDQEGRVVKRSAQNLNPHGFDFGIVQQCQGGRCNQNNAGGFGNLQLCGGAPCNQNNLGGFGHVQGCRGANCNQNNLSGFPGQG